MNDTLINFIVEYQRKHRASPTDSIISQGLNLTIEQVRARLNSLLADGSIQYSFTLCGKSIEII